MMIITIKKTKFTNFVIHNNENSILFRKPEQSDQIESG
jgi:hypothetical protein